MTYIEVVSAERQFNLKPTLTFKYKDPNILYLGMRYSPGSHTKRVMLFPILMSWTLFTNDITNRHYPSLRFRNTNDKPFLSKPLQAY